jgi:hypothetical protein
MESSDPARECRPTSLRRPAAHTCARSQTRYGVSTFRPRPKRRRSRRPRGDNHRSTTGSPSSPRPASRALAPEERLRREQPRWAGLGSTPAFMWRLNFLAAHPETRFALKAAASPRVPRRRRSGKALARGRQPASSPRRQGDRGPRAAPATDAIVSLGDRQQTNAAARSPRGRAAGARLKRPRKRRYCVMIDAIAA